MVDQNRNVTFKQARLKVFAAVTYDKKQLSINGSTFKKNAWFAAYAIDYKYNMTDTVQGPQIAQVFKNST